MAASEHPAPSSAHQPVEYGPDVPEIPAPQAPVREPPPAPARPSRAFGVVLTGVVLLFAFLASSTAVRNSNFWLHLATGRLLANGNYRFGADHYSYTATDSYRVSHAWLFDLGLYAAYQTFGGVVLVVLKASAITGLAGLLLRIRRPGMGVAIPAACTLLALLAMSPRLLLQPACVSLMLLGISLYLLQQPHRSSDPGVKSEFRIAKYGHVLLLLLFALWANLDEWFFLGPLLAALFWVGERLNAAGRRLTPGWLVPAGVVSCLLNPHFIRVFTSLPPELSPGFWASDLRTDPRFQSWFQRPWQLDYFVPSAGLNAAGLAYFALVALGLTSFILCRRNLVGWRLLTWGTFFLLGAWQGRTVAFFALVAGPITALNLQDAVAAFRTGAADPPRRRPFHGLAHGALLASGLALAVLVWPGWLQSVPHEHHRVSWQIQVNPSLQRVAETLDEWREEKLLSREERVFALYPDVADYFAWFAPREKGFLDLRSPRLNQLATRYEAVCRALASSRAGSEVAYKWREVLRDYGVSVVVLYDEDEQGLFTALHRMAPATDEWELLRVDGRALIFGWKPGRPGSSFGRLQLEPNRLAFGPVDADSALPLAPALGPQRPPQPPDWRQRYMMPAPAASWESDAATMYLRYFEERGPVEQRHALSAHAAAMVGAAAPGTPVAPDQVVVRLLQDIPGFGTRRPDLLLLAVRAARLAVAANPDDKNAWLRLGQAYYTLHHSTEETSGSGRSRLLDLLRHVQIATALENALLLDADLEPAHEGLSILYTERMFLDAALEHRSHALRLTRRGSRPGETEAGFRARLTAEEGAIHSLERLVQDQKNDYAIRSRSMAGDPLAKAQLALSLGLARTALDDVLLQSPVQTFGGEGARLELELLLQFGRAEMVREMLDDSGMRESKDKLGSSRVPAPARPGYLPMYRLDAYEWLRFLQAAASGDYDSAADALEDLVRPPAASSPQALRQLRSAFPQALTCELGLAAEPQFLFPRIMIQAARTDLLRLLTEVSFLSAQRADLHVLGGLLASERGTQTAALQSFDAATASTTERLPRGDFAAAPLAAAYRRRILAAANPR